MNGNIPFNPEEHFTAKNGNRRILLVDDEERIRAYVREALGIHGYEVAMAPSAETAMTLCTQPYSLLITDIVLPGMNGWDFATWFDSFHEGRTNILFISGYDSTSLNGSLKCRSDFLPKPFAYKELVEKVEALMT